ncbi:MAG TPA: hypothetical protein VMU61_11300 [Candidatus Aquilonibacter sp.]|nr:hypothetical protein [Candidatus Aquilonibacter sp.]
MANKLTYLEQAPRITRQFTTAVSLHGHTNHSRESLYFISEFASKRPLVRWALSQQDRKAQRESAIRMDLFKAYWTPPLPPLEAFTVERRQIEDGLGMRSLISLTDHDNIEAPLLLRVVPEARRIPVSIEWSIPFEQTVFHLGVHNLPTAEAETWVKRMAAYTEQPQPGNLWEMLSGLCSIPQVLLVFNHPLWDLPNVGRAHHLQAVKTLLEKANPFLHAFELGGLRTARENRAVIELAQAYNQPVIAGGDRHGCEPSALLNLTSAGSFSEFVEEVRHGHSHLLAMPQYSDCTHLRVYHTLLDVIRYYPDHPIGSRNWDERVYHPDSHGVLRPLSLLWEKPPGFVRGIFALLRMGEDGPMRRTLQLAFNRGPQTPRLELEGGQEVLS